MNGKKIKIALCLSGEPRSSMFCFPYYYETFLQSNFLFETDVYIHSWKNFRALPLYNPIKHKIDFIDQNRYIDNIFNESGLNNLLAVKKELEFFGNLTKKTQKLYNTLLMYSSIKNCFNLINNPEDYDVIIRGRFDLFFPNKLDLTASLLDLVFYKNSDVIVPYQQYDIPQPHISDQFALGTPKSMETYFTLIDNISSIIEETESVIPEVILSQHLRNAKLRIKDILSPPELVRGVNVIELPKLINSFLDE